MKNTLENLIEQAVREVLAEASDPQEAFDRFQELKSKYGSLFQWIEKIGIEPIREVLKVRDESEDYSDFFKKVGPGNYSRRTGNYERTNKFGMQPWSVKMFWDLDIGAEEALALSEEFQKLDDRFEYKSATSKADMMYGRRRTVVIDKLTGKTMSSTTDRKGSLGT